MIRLGMQTISNLCACGRLFNSKSLFKRINVWARDFFFCYSFCRTEKGMRNLHMQFSYYYTLLLIDEKTIAQCGFFKNVWWLWPQNGQCVKNQLIYFLLRNLLIGLRFYSQQQEMEIKKNKNIIIKAFDFPFIIFAPAYPKRHTWFTSNSSTGFSAFFFFRSKRIFFVVVCYFGRIEIILHHFSRKNKIER